MTGTRAGAPAGSGLPYDVKATISLDFVPGGGRCTLDLPLGAQVAARDVRDPDVTAPALLAAPHRLPARN